MEHRQTKAKGLKQRRNRALPWLKNRCRNVVVALLSRRLAVVTLLALLALEMTVLGVGLSRRIERSYERAIEMSEQQMALIEAEMLAKEMKGRGTVNIFATPEGEENAQQQQNNGEDGDTPPPLRPRPLDAILAQDGGGSAAAANAAEEADEGDVNPNAATVERSSDEGNDMTADAAEQQANDAAQEAVDTPAPTPLSREDQVKVDHLIRSAVTSMTAGDMRACVLSLEEAHAISPDHPALLYYYGLAYDKLLNPDKAREYYTQVFRMRGNAGKYFQRAARRLSFGYSRPSDMRGKLSFGPHQVSHSLDDETGEKVDVLLPVMLAPGEELNLSDVYLQVRFFILVRGRKIEFAPEVNTKWVWQNETPTWKDWEENLLVSFTLPPLTQEELDAYGDIKYYGFTAKIYYKGEPLDCISTPAALILQEQILKSRQNASRGYRNGLLPDDGLDSGYEEALPVSDFLHDLNP